MAAREKHRMQTLAVHGRERTPGPEGSLVYPIYQATVFTVPPGTGYDAIKYVRLNTTPTQVDLARRLADLEGAEAAVATGSGMAALTATLLAFLCHGDHILAGDSLYGGTHSFLNERAPSLGWQTTLVDAARPDTWRAALRPSTKLFLVETITNPLLRVPAIDEVVAFAREHNLVTLIDNTFATPVNYRPLESGFDLVFHSATKYLNGHSDLVAGCVLGRKDLVERVLHTLNLHGGTLDPHACYLLGRGLKTLALRVRAQNENAQALAEHLAQHPKVEQVHYPGLASHPDHTRARRHLTGFGGMLSFRPKGGQSTATKMLDQVRIAFPAPSLGGVETLITRPAATSHAGLNPEARAKMGVTDDLVRVSVGIESAADLIEDFDHALEAL